MDLRIFLKQENEQPLDNMAVNGGFCGILRTVACIGDSLSSGEFESFENGAKGYHDYFDYSWGQFMARDAGLTVHNFSKGGMSAEQYDAFARDKGYYAPELAARAYILALGVNDVTHILAGHGEFGGIDDVDPTDYAKNKPTFAGYYAKIIAKYQAIAPKAKFFLVTCPQSEKQDERQRLYDKHAALLYALAELFPHCYVIDLRKYGPVYDEAFRKTFYLGGHLTPTGYRLTAMMMESYIDYIIRHNPDDFKQIGFVGTPYHNANEKW